MTNIRHTWRTSAVSSTSGPTMKPGVSHRKSSGRSKASQSCMKRAALSAPSPSIAPARCSGLLAITPTGRPSMPDQRRDHAGRELPAAARAPIPCRPELDHGVRCRRRGAGLRARSRGGAAWSAQRPFRRAVPGSTTRYCLASRDGVGLVVDQHVDHAVGDLDVRRADLLGREDAEAAALDHGRTAHADVGVGGGDDHVAAAEQRGVAGEAAAETMPTSGTRPLSPPKSAKASVSRPVDHRRVGVAGAPAAAFGEEHHGQPQPFDRARRAGPSCGGSSGPGCRPAPCSRTTARRSALLLVAEVVPVDAADPGDEAVGRRVVR